MLKNVSCHSLSTLGVKVNRPNACIYFHFTNIRISSSLLEPLSTVAGIGEVLLGSVAGVIIISLSHGPSRHACVRAVLSGTGDCPESTLATSLCLTVALLLILILPPLILLWLLRETSSWACSLLVGTSMKEDCNLENNLKINRWVQVFQEKETQGGNSLQKNSTGSDNEFSQASPALYTRLNIQKEKARYASLSTTESNLEEGRGDTVQERGTGEQSRHGVSMLCPHGVVRSPHADLTSFSHMQREMTTRPICRSPPLHPTSIQSPPLRARHWPKCWDTIVSRNTHGRCLHVVSRWIQPRGRGRY